METVGGIIIGAIITWLYVLAITYHKELKNKKSPPLPVPGHKDYGFSIEIMDLIFNRDKDNIYRTKELYFATDLQGSNFYGINPSIPLTREEFLNYITTKNPKQLQFAFDQ